MWLPTIASLKMHLIHSPCSLHYRFLQHVNREITINVAQVENKVLFTPHQRLNTASESTHTPGHRESLPLAGDPGRKMKITASLRGAQRCGEELLSSQINIIIAPLCTEYRNVCGHPIK